MQKFFLILICIRNVFTQDCTFNTSNPYSPTIVEGASLLKHFGHKMDELLFIICPEGTSSTLLLKTGDLVACKGGTKILNIRTIQILDFTEIVCIPDSKISVKKLGKCENNYSLIEIGTQNETTPQFRVCFDQEKLRPFYTQQDSTYSLDTVEVSYEENICGGETNPCLFSDSGNMFPNVSNDWLYHNQKLILDELENYTGNLVRLPLATGGFYHKFPQKSQNLLYWDYSHVVPLWDVHFETWGIYYKYLHKYESDIYTGALDVATLPNSVEVYLGQIPVPKWVWMVFQSESAVLFLYNSFMEITGVEELCAVPDVSTVENLLWCQFSDIVHPVMKEFIMNKFTEQ